jgi:imidazolonepropionase
MTKTIDHIQDLIIRNAAELVTMTGGPKAGAAMRELGIIPGGDIAVSEGRITAIGRNLKLTGENEVDATGKTVMPGFVDPHTHLVFAGSRERELGMKIDGMTYLEILEQGGGILSTVRSTRTASLEEIVTQSGYRLDTMLEYGTTTAEAKSGYGLDTATELKQLRAIEELNSFHEVDLAPTFLGAHAVPEEFRGNTDGYVDLLVNEMIPAIEKENADRMNIEDPVGRRPVIERPPLARFIDVFCEKGVFTVKQSRRILQAGKDIGLIPKLHADEIVWTGGAELAGELGAISADHLLRISDEGIGAMKQAGTIATLLPATPLMLLQHEYADGRRMVDSGITVALATDLNPNCYTESMQLAMTLACVYSHLTPAEALTASTINSAAAIGLDSEVGSLEIGKKADILILDVPNHQHVPYHFGVNLVEMVVKDGEIVVF